MYKFQYLVFAGKKKVKQLLSIDLESKIKIPHLQVFCCHSCVNHDAMNELIVVTLTLRSHKMGTF